MTQRRLAVAHGLPIGLALTVVAALRARRWITLRMSGHYLPLATIAWGLALYYLLGNIDWLGKYDGLLGIPALKFFGIELGTGRSFFYLRSGSSRCWPRWPSPTCSIRAPGRAIRALKGGTTMAEAMGVDTFRIKVIAFVLAALLASVSGWLFAHFQRTVNPSPFGLNMGIEYLFMAVLGGVGHVWGAFLGAAVVQLVEDQLQVWLPQLIGTSGNYEIDRLRHPAGAGAAVRAATGSGPSSSRWLPRGAAHASTGPTPRRCRRATSRRAARSCSTSQACARSSAAWSRSTTSASRSAPARSSA